MDMNEGKLLQPGRNILSLWKRKSSGEWHSSHESRAVNQHSTFNSNPRYSSTYTLKEGVMVETPPTLKPNEKECHVIAHVEVCFHVNDLSRTEWVAGQEQPLQQKGRGWIVHISDFIIKRTGRLCLMESEQEAQMKLPCTPNIESIPTEPPQPKPTIKTPLVTASDTPRNMKVKEVKKAAKQKIKKEQKKKIKEIMLGEPREPTGTSAKGQTFCREFKLESQHFLSHGQRSISFAKFQCSSSNLSQCKQRSMVGHAAAYHTSECFPSL